MERPYRWSQRWYDDPPIGTVNLDGGRNPEIYLGNGEWQPLREGQFDRGRKQEGIHWGDARRLGTS